MTDCLCNVQKCHYCEEREAKEFARLQAVEKAAVEMRDLIARAMPVLSDDAMRLLDSSGHDKHQGPDAACDCECQNAMYAAETLRLAENCVKAFDAAREAGK